MHADMGAWHRGELQKGNSGVAWDQNAEGRVSAGEPAPAACVRSAEGLLSSSTSLLASVSSDAPP